MHSTTKYINGHSDVVGGAVIAGTRELAEQLAWWGNCLGLTGSAFDSFLTLRGLRTLHVRLREHGRNAQAIASAIADTPGLELYPHDVETNLIWFRIDAALGNSRDFTNTLKENGVLIHPLGPQLVRACTHLDVSAAQAARAAQIIRTVVPNMQRREVVGSKQ